jgi:hypothetical protein
METKICCKCNTEKTLDDFYSYKNKKRNWCKECDKINTILRQIIYKELCLEYKGGKCQKCGYNKYVGALEFHHRDPSQKNFNISATKLRKFDNKTIGELDKCDILCANCHREAHNIHDIEKLKNTWKKYKEQKLKRQDLNKIKKNICECGNKKSIKSKKCSKCRKNKMSERNVEEVIAKIKETNWVQAGKFFGVSDNALRKFLKKHKIDISNIK